MNYKDFLTQLLNGYRNNFDIEEYGDREEGLIATAHMHVEEYQCAIFKECKMWTADADEYVYIYRIPKLDAETATRIINETHDDGMPKIDLDHVSFKNQHMCTHLVALIIADEADAEAIKRIKKCKIYKNFMFSLKGWMEMHTALVTLSDNKIYHNRYGKSTGDYIKMHIDHYMAKCK